MHVTSRDFISYSIYRYVQETGLLGQKEEHVDPEGLGAKFEVPFVLVCTFLPDTGGKEAEVAGMCGPPAERAR